MSDTTDHRPQGRTTMLVLLVAAAVLNYADRGIFALAMPAIKREYSFTDSQLGLLSGVAFGVFYGIAALPIGYLATRVPRRSLLAVCLAFWSAATTLTAMAHGFGALFVARLNVGIGEAGGLPVSLALIAARYEPTRRATATGWMNAGTNLGTILGALATGVLIADFGWRTAFLCLGLPGLLLALLMRLLVAEPDDMPPRAALPWRQIAQAFRDPALVQLILAMIATGFSSYGLAIWTPTFYQRVMGMRPDQVGLVVGLMFGSAQLIGSVVGGFVVDRIGKGQTAFGLNLAIRVTLVTIPMGVVGFLTHNPVLSLGLISMQQFATGMRIIVCYTALQNLTSSALRPFIIAISASALVLVGSGLAPLCVGVISDHAPGGVATGLAVMSAVGLWFVAHCWRAAVLVRRSQ